MKTNSFIAGRLRESNIKPSPQRIKILEYLANYPCHPTVDRIYSALLPDMPTLSKSTVYNTLKILRDARLVREVTIEENEVHYEYAIKAHGHFRCLDCGEIYDFQADAEEINTDELRGFCITEKDIYFKGVCGQCLKRDNQTEK